MPLFKCCNNCSRTSYLGSYPDCKDSPKWVSEHYDLLEIVRPDGCKDHVCDSWRGSCGDCTLARFAWDDELQKETWVCDYDHEQIRDMLDGCGRFMYLPNKYDMLRLAESMVLKPYICTSSYDRSIRVITRVEPKYDSVALYEFTSRGDRLKCHTGVENLWNGFQEGVFQRIGKRKAWEIIMRRRGYT